MRIDAAKIDIVTHLATDGAVGNVCLAFSGNNNRNNRQSVFHLVYSIYYCNEQSHLSFSLYKHPVMTLGAEYIRILRYGFTFK